MNATHQIDPTTLQKAIDPNTAKVLDLLHTFCIETRIVGGAVRDLLQGHTPRDIDLVADADPSALIYIFESHGLGVDLGGIQHGTVKAVFGHGHAEQKVDVSSLGYRIRRHGQELTIDRTHSWLIDSELRDLTINSMSMTLDGKIYDYQNGIKDLETQTVRMCLKSQDSMTLDPVGMLRYFRAVSRSPHARVIKKDLTWLVLNRWRLANHPLDKKVSMLLISILGGVNRDGAVKLACALGFDTYLGVLPCEVNSVHTVEEALKISRARPYVKAWDPNYHKSVFERQPNKDRNAYRVYVPFESEVKQSIKIPEDLQQYLATAIPGRPYITDSDNYIQGLAFEQSNPARKLGIGKMLARSESSAKDPVQKAELAALKKRFDADPQRAATKRTDKLIAFSRHPYDIAGMSTDRGWSSCMNIVDGSNRRYVLRDVKAGSVIAYLINSDDLNIRRPLARILIKPYQEKGNPSNLAMMADQVYGTAPSSFAAQVTKWVDANYNAGKNGLFCLTKGLYSDSIPRQFRLVGDEGIKQMPAKDLINAAYDSASIWQRIHDLRPDSDQIFLAVIKKGMPEAAKMLKEIDVSALTPLVKIYPRLIGELPTQPPELVNLAMKQDSQAIMYLRNRTLEQEQQILSWLKAVPWQLYKVNNPTPEQIRLAANLDSDAREYALGNFPHVFDTDHLREMMLKVAGQAGLEIEDLQMFDQHWPGWTDDPQVFLAVTKNPHQDITWWLFGNKKLNNVQVQTLIINTPGDDLDNREFFAENTKRLAQRLQEIPDGEILPKLKSALLRKAPVLLLSLSGDHTKEIRKAIENNPEIVNQITNPSPELVELAVRVSHQSDEYLDVTAYQTPEYDEMWTQLVTKDPNYVIWVDPGNSKVVKIALKDSRLDYYRLRDIAIQSNKLSPALQVMLLKRYPRGISRLNKPSVAAQLAAVNADPDVYELIRPRDRSPALKAWIRAYRREMAKP